MNNISNELAKCTVKTIDDELIPFSSLYTGHTTFIFFVRHFGCIFCRERVSSLRNALTLLESHQFRACVVGNGTPNAAADFVDHLELPFPVYCDREGHAYRLAGMQRNFGLNLSSVKDAWRSYQSGHRQNKPAGDVWQQGGVIVVTPNGQVLATIADQSAGDYIDIPDLVASLTQNKENKDIAV